MPITGAKPAGNSAMQRAFRGARLACCGVFLALISCAAPGPPMPPHPPIPEAVTDLQVRQQGDAVVLSFTLPKKTVEGEALEHNPQVEILRGEAPKKPPPQPPRTAVYTIPGQLVDTYLSGGRVEFTDPLPPQEFAKLAGRQLVYAVRTSESKRASSEESNAAGIAPRPTPLAITDLSAQVTRTAIVLHWTAPAATASGAPLPPLGGYHVYRAEAAAQTAAGGATGPESAPPAAAPSLEGVTATTDYRDADFQFGHTYFYTVRSVAQYDTGAIESADSNRVVVRPEDIFPPSAPEGVTAVAVPATASVPEHAELSWRINPETDVSGYNVYRMGTEGEGRERLNKELLLVPVFRDMSTVGGKRYSYTVTAVSRAGLEGPPSKAVSIEMPAPGGGAQP
jgi:hypothetical protein